MNWDDTRIFLAVARSGQILAAAGRLQLNHATVARRVSALEDALGVKLLVRQPSGSQLTDAGQRFFEAAERMEAEMAAAQASIGTSDMELAGTVRIGAPDGFAVAFLAKHLGALRAEHSALNLQLVPMHRSFSLSKREADIAVMVGPPEQGRLISRRLVDYRLGLYAAQCYLSGRPKPETAQDLSLHNLVGYVEDLVYSPALDYAGEFWRGWRSSLEFASALAQYEAVAAGAGIGILHRFIAINDRSLVPVLPQIQVNRSYHLVYHESNRNQRRIRLVCDFIEDAVQQHKQIF
ncbi:LysR family transcriptional regulator [Polycladidibacter hongkongensis]|uniref:LysR family transcriptional regulator n=1 Tax=Polycladidibacter hongkongensis TaxID=1647556 RepID=UPI00082D9E91|nr:LysR family transcriptional regulator [Pseudovibrio hongkongensis]